MRIEAPPYRSPWPYATSALVCTIATLSSGSLLFGAFLGAAAWVAVAGRLYLSRPDHMVPAPWRLRHPWRDGLEEAIASAQRYEDLVDRLAGGPMQDRLRELAPQVRSAVTQVWQVTRLGVDLTEEQGAGPGSDELRQTLGDVTERLDALTADFDDLLAHAAALSLAQGDARGGGAGDVVSGLTAIRQAVATMNDELPGASLLGHVPERSGASRGIGVALVSLSAVIVAASVVAASVGTGVQEDRPCPAPGLAGEAISAPGRPLVLAQEQGLSMQDAAGGKYGSQERLALLGSLGALRATSELWQTDGAIADVKLIWFPDAESALAYARSDAEVICAFSAGTFAPEGIPGGAGIRQRWREGPGGYWAGVVTDSLYVRAYTRWEDQAEGQDAVTQAVRASVARRAPG